MTDDEAHESARATRAPGRPRRPRRPAHVIAIVFQVLTAIASLPVVYAATSFAPRAAIAVAFCAVILGVGARVHAGYEDRRRPAWIGAFAIPLFDLAWVGVALSIFGCLFALPTYPWVGLRGVAAIGSMLTLTAATWGALVRRRWVVVERLEVALDGWPKSLDGYRVVQLSDLHVGTTASRDTAKTWSDRATALDADLVVVTGDLLTTGTAFHADVAEALAPLRARDGVFACLGNHDYYDEASLCARLAKVGVRVLRNEGVALRGGDFFLAGVEDLWRGKPDVARALVDCPRDTPAILLAHNPRQAPLVSRGPVALILSGHTHAGQFAIPFLARFFSLAHLAEAHVVGLYRLPNATLFVHPGIGTTGPAVRIGSVPAIVELTLRAR